VTIPDREVAPDERPEQLARVPHCQRAATHP
jgi:hypothetical protein